MFAYISAIGLTLQLQAVELFDDATLFQLIVNNQHLQRVRDQDSCQLVADIKLRAIKLEKPAYQYVYGDMLMWGICLDQDSEEGWHWITQAAKQGLPVAHEQMGRYYLKGIQVQKNRPKALHHLYLGAQGGNLKAQLQLVQQYAKGHGHPMNYPKAYSWLYHRALGNPEQQRQAQCWLDKLTQHLPPHQVEKIQSQRN